MTNGAYSARSWRYARCDRKTDCAEFELKDLWNSYRTASKSYLDMHKAGKITNLNKHDIMRGKSVFSIAHGTKELFDWVSDNPSMCCAPIN